MVWDRGAMHSFLRPEVMESLFVLYRVTGDDIYRQWGKRIFDSINKYARVEGGFASVRNVEVSRTLSRTGMAMHCAQAHVCTIALALHVLTPFLTWMYCVC